MSQQINDDNNETVLSVRLLTIYAKKDLSANTSGVLTIFHLLMIKRAVLDVSDCHISVIMSWLILFVLLNYIIL